MIDLIQLYWDERRHLADTLVTAVREGQWRSSGKSPRLGDAPKFRIIGAYSSSLDVRSSLDHYVLGVAPAIPHLHLPANAIRLFRANYNTACQELERWGLLEVWNSWLKDEGHLYYTTPKKLKPYTRLPKGILKASTIVLRHAEVKTISRREERKLYKLSEYVRYAKSSNKD